VREYVLPHAGTMPRRIALTPDDAVWYADYGRGYLDGSTRKRGRQPADAKWRQHRQPAVCHHGLSAISSGMSNPRKPNMLVRFDPAAEQFQRWPIPSGGGVVRHRVHAPDGTLWLACSGVDRIARVVVSPATNRNPQ
jgi:virginiamycin B lyase